MTRVMHQVLTHTIPPDGKQFVMCVCPVGVDHPPIALITPTDEPGLFWVRYT